MREILRQRPWLWIVLLLGALVSASTTFAVIAMRHPPISVKVP